jgi:hypothetical protein
MDVFLELLEAIPEHPYFGVNSDPSNTLVAGDDPDRIDSIHSDQARLGNPQSHPQIGKPLHVS